MINAKVKIFNGSYSSEIEKEVNIFLESIDIRQVIKMEITSTGDDNKRIYMLITYVDFQDIRDSKIDSILDTKN